MFNYPQRPTDMIPGMAHYDTANKILEKEHTGFCLSTYKQEICKDCYCEHKCLELRRKDLIESGFMWSL